jgi:hypothetical protein
VKPASNTKVASATVYLMEELGDARMRCDQLLRYIDKAVKVIEKSSHKDHFFEVAGDLIRGIPETVFKLHKALEAVALAANRIDYEEIKQDLRPEKVEELERVLKDVRVRQVQRRSLPMVNPASVVEQLKSLAKKAREGGNLDTEGLATLIASLEVWAPKVADDAGARVAAQLEAMAHALENPPEGEQPSRYRLAQVLRKTYAEHVEVTAAGQSKETNVARVVGKTGGDSDEKRSRFEEGKPADPTKHMDPEDAKAWKENTEEFGDKFKKEAAKPSDVALNHINTAILGLKQLGRGIGNPKRTLHNVIISLSNVTSALGQDEQLTKRLNQVARYINQSFSVADMRDSISVPVVMASEDEKRSRFEEGKPADPTKDMDPEDAKAWKENTDKYEDKFKKEAGVEDSLPLLKRLADQAAEAAKQLKHSVGLVERDPRKYQPQVSNIQNTVSGLSTLLRAVERRIFDTHTASEKSAGGQLIPAPPMNVVEEIMAWHGGMGSKLYSVGSRWTGGHKVDTDDAEEAYDELERLKADHGALADFADHLREFGVTPDSVKKRYDAVNKRELKEMQGLLTKAGFNGKDAKRLQEEGMGPEELKQRLRRPAGAVGSLEYTHNLERKTKKASDDSALWKAE